MNQFQAYGEPIAIHGEGGRYGRRRFAYQKETDELGRDLLSASFWIRGPNDSGRVVFKVRRSHRSDPWEYTFLSIADQQTSKPKVLIPIQPAERKPLFQRLFDWIK